MATGRLCSAVELPHSLDEYQGTVPTRFNGGIFTYANNTTYFNRTDHLGTPRLTTDYTGTVQRTENNLPFGDNESPSAPTVDFTGFANGYWDSESNADQFGEREYAKTSGRWMRPDPAGMAAVDPTNPQSWNRYAYVTNNPLSLTDPTGLDPGDDEPTSNGCGSGGGDNCTGNGEPTNGFLTQDQNQAQLLSLINMSVSYTGFGPSYADITIDVDASSLMVRWGNALDSGYGGGLIGPTPAANNQSYAWTFTKAFFKNFSLKAVYNSFVDENGCDRQLFGTFAGDLVPFPTDETPGPVDAVEPTAKFLSAVTYNQALNYAATTGPTYPLKSSVFRGFLGLSEGIEASVPAVTAGVATVHALGTTIASAASGECH